LDFQQTHTNDVLWDRGDFMKFWRQKVTVQGHGGGTVTAQVETCSTLLSSLLLVV